MAAIRSPGAVPSLLVAAPVISVNDKFSNMAALTACLLTDLSASLALADIIGTATGATGSNFCLCGVQAKGAMRHLHCDAERTRQVIRRS